MYLVQNKYLQAGFQAAVVAERSKAQLHHLRDRWFEPFHGRLSFLYKLNRKSLSPESVKYSTKSVKYNVKSIKYNVKSVKYNVKSVKYKLKSVKLLYQTQKYRSQISKVK